MKRLLEFVNESQDTSNIVSNNKIMQEVCNYNNSRIYYMHVTLKYIKHKIFYIMTVMKEVRKRNE